MNEEVIFEDGHFVGSSDLYGRYRSWCEQHGEQALADKQLKAAFEALNLIYDRVRSGSVWKGIKLRLS